MEEIEVLKQIDDSLYAILYCITLWFVLWVIFKVTEK